MRAGARLGWRVATAVVFGATAALAVIVSRGAPMSAHDGPDRKNRDLIRAVPCGREPRAASDPSS